MSSHHVIVAFEIHVGERDWADEQKAVVVADGDLTARRTPWDLHNRKQLSIDSHSNTALSKGSPRHLLCSPVRKDSRRYNLHSFPSLVPVSSDALASANPTMATKINMRNTEKYGCWVAYSWIMYGYNKFWIFLNLKLPGRFLHFYRTKFDLNSKQNSMKIQ